MAKIAERTETTPAVVRRLVGTLDPATEDEKRRQQEKIARRIDAKPLPWSAKVELWQEETGQSETTLWRVLKRLEV